MSKVAEQQKLIETDTRTLNSSNFQINQLKKFFITIAKIPLNHSKDFRSHDNKLQNVRPIETLVSLASTSNKFESYHNLKAQHMYKNCNKNKASNISQFKAMLSQRVVWNIF